MLRGLHPVAADPALLVGVETGDDAAVYRLDDTQAVIATADYITPVIDDPFLFGRVAAANALSDVYAMGGRPLVAVALCLFPKELEPEAARLILEGGRATVAEAGAVVGGGHTVRSGELLYGLAVTGVVHPARVVRNVGARAGDALILTKPLGSGLVVNGLRRGAIDEARARPVIERLAVLNRAASEVAVAAGAAVHAATDVTGFGLVGHALGMARGSGVTFVISLSSLPRYPHVEELVAAGVTTGSTKPNRAHGAAYVRGELAAVDDQLVHDPQTSGGLLLAVDGDAADGIVARLRARGVSDACVVGRVEATPLDAEPGLVFTS
jgi:selenide,water dikinase